MLLTRTRTRRTLYQALWFLVLAPAVLAQVYVDPRLGDDQNGTGAAAAPFRSISRALTASASGTTIHAAAGFYSAATGETLPLRLASGVRILGEGPQECFLTGGGTGSGVMADRPLDQTTGFEGFTVRGFSAGVEVRSTAVLARFADLRIEGGSIGVRVLGLAAGLSAPRFESCVIISCGNQGVLVTAQLASDLRPVFVNCVVASCQGGGIGAVPQAAGSFVGPRISFCTVTRNGGRGVYADNGGGQSGVELYNSIVTGHSQDVSNVAAGLTGTNLLGGSPLVGIRGNFTGSPGFLDEFGGDFHLLGGSAALDRADDALPEQPSTDREGQARPGGGRNDVGADERELHTLYTPGPDGSRVGRPLVFRHIGNNGDLVILMLSFGTRMPGFTFQGLSGSLVLDVGILLQPLGAAFITSVSFGDISVPLPDDSGIVGMRLFFQSVGLKSIPGGVSGGFSGILDPVLLTR